MSFDFSSIPWIGAFASLVAGSATVLGALGVFVMPKKSPLLEDVFMSFAAGIMLAASFFSLILTGLEAAKDSGFSDLMGVSTVIFGILAGASFVWILNYFIPHEHFNMGKEGVMDSLKLKRIWLFVIAIAIHNFPEGMAVGVGLVEKIPLIGLLWLLAIPFQMYQKALPFPSPSFAVVFFGFFFFALL